MNVNKASLFILFISVVATVLTWASGIVTDPTWKQVVLGLLLVVNHFAPPVVTKPKAE